MEIDEEGVDWEVDEEEVRTVALFPCPFCKEDLKNDGFAKCPYCLQALDPGKERRLP
jgi:hypothetical protein